MSERLVPPRIFRVSFRTPEGLNHWRYVKCPYQIRSPEDWADSLEGMQKSLAGLVLEARIKSFRVSVVEPERITASVRQHLVRWSTVAEGLAA